MAKPRPQVKLTTATVSRESPGDAGADIPSTGRTVAIGVGVKTSELELLDRIAADHELARNAVLRFAVRYFLREYQAGRVDLQGAIQTATTRKLRMP